MVMSTHWIVQDWRQKTRIFGAMHFPKKYTTTNISDSLLSARIDFYVLPKSVEGRIPQSEEALSNDRLAYLETKPTLDAPLLTSDFGSDVSAGAKKTTFWIAIAMHILVWA